MQPTECMYERMYLCQQLNHTSSTVHCEGLFESTSVGWFVDGASVLLSPPISESRTTPLLAADAGVGAGAGTNIA